MPVDEGGGSRHEVSSGVAGVAIPCDGATLGWVPVSGGL